MQGNNLTRSGVEKEKKKKGLNGRAWSSGTKERNSGVQIKRREAFDK